MATSSQKIRYDIEAAVSGEGDVAALARQLESLADTLEGDLKTQAQASAQALRELGAKQGVIDNFVQLKKEAGDAADRLSEAQTAAQKLGRELTASTAPTRAQAGQLEKLRDAVRTAKTELQGKTTALEQSRAALNRYGIGTANLAQSERNVRAAVAAARAEVASMAPAYNAAGAAAASSGQRQVQAASSVKGELAGLSQQLATLRNLAGVALGGTVVGSLAKDIGETADQYANLSARIQLATGEGEAFTQGMADVQRIAQSTNSELDATATLYTRLVQTGKDAGLSAKDAQTEAASLTEVINQSIQLSGASSQAAQAAVTQLIQGLQSGVLRGEEFNSVVEQSPRLARALADGLGVTIGRLREMAQQGQITTEVLKGALGGQAQAIAAEFEKLPPTIGRAMQSLSNAWTVYIGEADKATGASRAVADAIAALGRNLDTIIGLLLDAGQAGAAFVALRLAQSFLGIGAAAQAAAVQVAASTAAMNAAGAASLTAGAGVGKFASLLGSLKTFSLIGIVANIRDIGTWIGEAAAKLAGYKDLTDQMARDERIAAEISRENARQKAALAQAIQLATEKARGLTPGARILTGEFEKLREGGRGVADALADISKNANLSDTAGIQAFSIAMRDLAVQGKASGDQIREAFANALKGEDLASFETRARAALSGARDEAELLSTVLDASLREAIRRSGSDFDVISGGMGAAARSAINDTELIITNLERLKSQGVNTAAALTASLSKGIQTADGQAAIEALRQQIELVRSRIGDSVANSFLDQLSTKARQVTQEIGGLSAALKSLGITSDADLKLAANGARKLYEEVRKTGGSAREQQAAFRKMAEAAIASGDTASLAFVRSQASIQGFEVSVDKAGETTVRAMGEGRAAVDRLTRGMQASTEAVNGYTKGVADAAAQLQRLKELQGFAGAGGDLSGVSTEELKKAQADLLKEGGALSSPEYIKLRNELMGRGAPKTDASGFTLDKSGNTLAMGGELNTLTGIANFLKQAGLDDAQARNLAREFADSKGEIPYFNNPGQIKYGGRESTLSEALLKAAERTTFGYGNAGAAGVGREVTVKLVSGGVSRTVPTNEEGAKALIETLRDAKLAAGG